MQTTARTLWEKFIVHYGLPEKVLLDQGSDQVECYSHCTLPENSVQTEYDMETDTQTNSCIPDAGWTGICLQTEILVPPWKSVLDFPHTVSKWSRLIWTTLGCVTFCTWCDHPRWSCINMITVHRWCWS